MIEVTILGTAALSPLPDRALSAAMLSHSGRSILFDCGEGTQSAARKAGVSPMHTDLIALTHYHGDHIFGLPGLLQTLTSMERTELLTVTGPAGLQKELSPILTLAGTLSFPLRLLELPPEGIALSELLPGWKPGSRLTPIPTVHRVESCGYLFTLDRAGKFLPEKADALGVPLTERSKLQNGEAVRVGDRLVLPEEVLGEPRKGLRVVFTGDTGYCDSLVSAAADADLLISEATYGEPSQQALAIERGHMTFTDAASLAAASRAKRLCMIHFSQRLTEPAEYLPFAAEIFPDAVCGEDGMKWELAFEE